MEQLVDNLLAKSRTSIEVFSRQHELDSVTQSSVPKEKKITTSRHQRLVKTDEDKKLIRLALHRSSFFTCLDEEQIERFIEVAELREYQDNDVIIHEGEQYDEDPYYKTTLTHPISYVYSIQSGTVEVVQQGHALCNFGPGMLFGEGAILFNRAHSASVIAKHGNVQCWVVPSQLFSQYVLTSENMVRMFTKYASQSVLGSIDNDTEPFLTMVCRRT